MSYKVRAKFKCQSVKEFGHGQKEAELTAVCSDSDENAQFAQATPSGELKITIDPQTEAVDFFKPSEDYYLDFSIVPKGEPYSVPDPIETKPTAA